MSVSFVTLVTIHWLSVGENTGMTITMKISYHLCNICKYYALCGQTSKGQIELTINLPSPGRIVSNIKGSYSEQGTLCKVVLMFI